MTRGRVGILRQSRIMIIQNYNQISEAYKSIDSILKFDYICNYISNDNSKIIKVEATRAIDTL